MEEWIKKLQEKAEINTRNQSASLKKLETPIEQLTKELHYRTTNGAPSSSTEQCKVVDTDHETPHRPISSSKLNNLHVVSHVQVAQNEEERTTEVLQCQFLPKELNPINFTLHYTIGNFNFYGMADLGASVNVMPRNTFEYLRLANLRNTNMLVEMADMTKKAPLEDERDEMGIEIEKYDPPEVQVETFEVRKYSFKGEQNFVCVTKEVDDALPLGRRKGSRFREMIWKEFDIDAHDKTFQQLGDDSSLREALLTEAHSSPFSIHPGSTKMYRDLKHNFRWNGLQNACGMRLKFSNAFHPQTDGQTERTIQTLEDIWHASIKGAPFELLYGRKCRAPIYWNEVEERVIEGRELVEVTNEKVAIAKEKLKEARSRQKSYADRHRRALEFKPGNHVFLKVSPCRGVRRFGLKGKLSPLFICPFEILDRVGEVSYRLALPPQLPRVHNVFHVSLLRGYNYHPYHVVQYPFDKIREVLSFAEEPEAILDRQERVMRKKTIPLVKVLWKNHPEREAT
ncbi:putative nucleotidyltransferase, ribonuclease H [Tanacetum coccineum]